MYMPAKSGSFTTHYLPVTTVMCLSGRTDMHTHTINCEQACEMYTFLSMTNKYIHVCIHHENISSIQSLALMCLATMEILTDLTKCPTAEQLSLHPVLRSTH